MTDTNPVAPELIAPTALAKPTTKPAAKKTRDASGVKRVTIVLAKHPDIPPTGLFLGHNGTGYKLIPGKEASIPEFLLDILDNAVESRPVVEDGQIVGYEDAPRFSYREVRTKS